MSSEEGKPKSAPSLSAATPGQLTDQDANAKMNTKVQMGEALGTDDTPSGLEATDALGRQLKKVYGKLLSEPVPDKFFELLRRLDQHATPPRKSNGDPESA